MRTIFLLWASLCIHSNLSAQKTATKTQPHMRLNAGIITTKLAESKAFYTQVLGLGITFENDFYLLLHTPDGQVAISFLLPDHPSQQPVFQKPFNGQGMYLTIEVDDLDKMYRDICSKAIPIAVELREEPWGDRHFAILDPNGIGIDIVHYTATE